MTENHQISSLPETGFIRQPQVLHIASFSSTTLWRRCKAGTFPQPIRLSPRICAWRVEDVRAWVKAQWSNEVPAARSLNAAKA